MRKAIDTICGTICICHSEFEKREKLVLSFEKIIKIEI
nr:MAG TPA: glycoprotein [Caudoviricetes sp.]